MNSSTVHLVEGLTWWVAEADDTATSKKSQDLAGVGIGIEQQACGSDGGERTVVRRVVAGRPAHRSGKVGILGAVEASGSRARGIGMLWSAGGGQGGAWLAVSGVGRW